MRNMALKLAFLTLAAIFVGQVACQTVPTTAGHLRGTTIRTNDRPFMKFLGVPYAKPPQRFSRAEELATEAEKSMVDARVFKPSCMQPPHLRKVIYKPLHDDLDESMVSENCLNLNIYVPGAKINDSAEPMAVMVWLPGEGFDYGFANQYDGSKLATFGNVIVVTVNYRLSVFGFLSTGDEQAPGNLGLSDQLMALSWLKKNIGRFGGNPEKITVFGRLSGSMSISALLMSTRNGPKLINRAIMQSGIAQSDWTFEEKPLEQAIYLGKIVGCLPTTADKANTTRLISCLRKVPAKILMKSALRSPSPWRLVIDGQFLLETPLKRAEKALEAPVDVMLGTNEHEGSVCLLSHLVQKTEYVEKFLNNTLSSTDLGHLIDSHISNYYGSMGVEGEDVRSAVYNLYKCGNEKETLQECRQQFLDFCGDLYSHTPVTQMAQALATFAPKGSNIYKYEFTHRPSFSHYPDFVRAAQGDEVLFVLGLVDEESKMGTPEEARLRDQMMSWWTNFAKTGNPNSDKKSVTWPKFNEKGEYLQISMKMGEESVKVSKPSQRLDFWMQFNKKHTTTTTTL